MLNLEENSEIHDFDHLIDNIYHMIRRDVDHRTRRRDNMNVMIKRNEVNKNKKEEIELNSKTKEIVKENTKEEVVTGCKHHKQHVTFTALVVQNPSSFKIENEKMLINYSYNEVSEREIDDFIEHQVSKFNTGDRNKLLIKEKK
jgi:hypothetical protein